VVQIAKNKKALAGITPQVPLNKVELRGIEPLTS